jgi:hypothetical protein
MITNSPGTRSYRLVEGEDIIMLKRLAFAVLGLALLGGVARAQEAEDEEVRREPARKIKVLQDPKDIASFYRSSPGEYSFGYDQGQADSRYPIAGFYRGEGDGRYPIAGFYRGEGDGRYPIAGFYRGRQSSYGYAPFWNHGYGYRRSGAIAGYRRRIGENGDLFLLAPFLAPLGPLNGAFAN